MDSLLLLLSEDDKNVMIAIAQGVVPMLVRLLFENEGKDSCLLPFPYSSCYVLLFSLIVFHHIVIVT